MVFVDGFPADLLRIVMLFVVPDMSADSPAYLLTLSLVCKEFRCEPAAQDGLIETRKPARELCM